MQSLDIVSVNLWQILISLANLVLIFLIVKKFLFGPVKKMLAQRQAAVDEQLSAAAAANEKARQDQAAWEQKIQTAQTEADGIVKDATAAAREQGDRMVAEARDRAAQIIRQAENEAVLEHKKAESAIREEIVTVSTKLAEKMLQREIRAEDHRALIASFMQEIGDAHDSDS